MKTLKKIQNFYLYSYRLVGFIFLSGLIISILWYGFSLLFFMSNSSWSVPIILSPNQEKVMSHLEHVVTFEQEISKNKAELRVKEQELEDKKKVLAINEDLWERVNQSMSYQSSQYLKASAVLRTLSQEKITHVNQLKRLASQIKKEEKIIKQELKLGLITKQEALLSQFNWNKLSSSIVDEKTNLYDLKKRSRDYAEAAITLKGEGNHLITMNKVIKKVELENQITEIKSDILSLQIKIKDIQKYIDKKVQTLNSMKNSPYILATKKETPVAFIPYSHLNKVQIGAPVFSCFLDMILCYQSGHVLSIYSAEEYAKHPIFKSDIKGQLIGIAFDNQADAQKKLLFINSKPLLI